MLAEKGLEFDLKLELTWNRRHDFMVLNPAGTLPVLVEEKGHVFAGPYSISEYLHEKYPDIDLLGQSKKDRAETRRLTEWFDVKFNHEVTELLVTEKILKGFLKRGMPDAAFIRAGAQNIKHHLKYIEYLADRRNWLAGDQFSMADISAAAHLSCVDYLGDIPWADFKIAKEWYARVKSRPSVQPLLKDTIAGLKPADHYRNLDF